jgi:hypothetical protein
MRNGSQRRSVMGSLSDMGALSRAHKLANGRISEVLEHLRAGHSIMEIAPEISFGEAYLSFYFDTDEIVDVCLITDPDDERLWED